MVLKTIDVVPEGFVYKVSIHLTSRKLVVQEDGKL